MKAVIQRVTRAEVRSGGQRAAIGRGLLVLVGLETGDTVETCAWAAAKIASLRLFEDAGFFQEHMQVELVNDGPVTFILER